MSTRNVASKAWLIVAMLFLFQAISTLDKLVLSLASVHLMDELQLTPLQYGTIASSLYWLFAISGVLFGVLFANRIPSKWTLLLLVSLWSLVQFPVLCVSGYLGLLLCRVLLGAAEGPGYPSVMHAAYRWFPPQRRNLPTAIISQGVAFGFLIGGWLLTSIILAYGWRSAFVFCGLVGLLWVVIWFCIGEDGPIGHTDSPKEREQRRISYWQIARDPSIVGLVVMLIGGYWISSLSVSWLTPYLSKGLGYDLEQTGWLTSVILGVSPPLMLGLTWLSERLLLRGWSSRVARGWLAAGTIVSAGAALLLAVQLPLGVSKVVLLLLGFKLPHLAFILSTAIVGEVVPNTQRGPVLHVLFAGVTSVGFIAPVVFGWIVQAPPGALFNGYDAALQFSAALLLVSGALGLLLIHPERSVARLRVRQA
jgi:MFS family permease